MEFRELEVKDYPSFLKLYNETFPADERRLYKSAEHVASFVKEKGGKFKGFVYDDGGEDLVGSDNTGRKMLSHLFDIAGPDVLIEVEKPETEEARRRIAFYEKNGFRMREDINYVQPPYSAEQTGIEMMLMTHGDVNLRDTRDLREMLTEVYNVNHGV